MLVRQRLNGQPAAVDDDAGPDQRLIAIANDANADFSGSRTQREQRAELRRARRYRQIVRAGQRRVPLDDQVRRCAQAQPLRLALMNCSHHDFAHAAPIDGEGLRAAHFDALQDLHVLLAVEVGHHIIHRMMRLVEGVRACGSAAANDVALGPPAGRRHRCNAGFWFPRRGTIACLLALRCGTPFIFFLSHE